MTHPRRDVARAEPYRLPLGAMTPLQVRAWPNRPSASISGLALTGLGTVESVPVYIAAISYSATRT